MSEDERCGDSIQRSIDLVEQLDLDYSLDNLPRIIERTREGLRRIERIVKDLRLFARVDEGEWNEVDLNPGIESSVGIVQGYARKHGVAVVMDLEPLADRSAAGPRGFIKSSSILLMNAIDACPGRRERHDPHADRLRWRRDAH